MIESVGSVLMQIGRFSMKELVMVELRKVLPNIRDYVGFVSHFIKTLCSSKLVKEEINGHSNLRRLMYSSWMSILGFLQTESGVSN